jgi:hypothetical protein
VNGHLLADRCNRRSAARERHFEASHENPASAQICKIRILLDCLAQDADVLFGCDCKFRSGQKVGSSLRCSVSAVIRSMPTPQAWRRASYRLATRLFCPPIFCRNSPALDSAWAGSQPAPRTPDNRRPVAGRDGSTTAGTKSGAGAVAAGNARPCASICLRSSPLQVNSCEGLKACRRATALTNSWPE